MLGIGVGLTSVRAASGGAVDPHADAYFYDDFARGPEALNGSTPVKGNAWSATGTAADLMSVDNGIMSQTGVVANNSGYGYSDVPGATLKRIRAKFKYSDTPDFGPCIAIVASGAPQGNSNDVALHGEMGTTFHYLRLLNNDQFLDPHWYLREANFSLVSGTEYILDLVGTSEWGMMTLSDADGVAICREIVWDDTLFTYLGDYFFVQTLSDNIEYTEVNLLKADPVIPVVTLDFALNTNFADDAAGFGPNTFGGTVEHIEGGGLSISTSSNFAGAQVALGRDLVVGQKVWVSLGVTVHTGQEYAVSIVPYGTGSVSNDGGYPSGYIGLASGAGRRQVLLTMTADCANAALLIGDTDNAAVDIDLNSAKIIIDPPTSIPS